MFSTKRGFGILAFTVGAIALAIIPAAAMAANTATISSVVLNGVTFPGGTAIPVTSGQTITTTINATNSTTTNWTYTGWEITNSNTNPTFFSDCTATPNATSSGAHAPTISISVPTNLSAGTNNLYLQPFSSNTCFNNSVGALFKTTSSINVIVPTLNVTQTSMVTSDIVNTPFTLTFGITDSNATATYSNGNTIFSDDLQTTAPIGTSSYGTPADVEANGTTGNITCSVQTQGSNKSLNCTATGTVNIPVGGTITVTLPVTPSASGSFVNPKSGGGSCEADLGNARTNCSPSSIPVNVTSVPAASVTILPSSLPSGTVNSVYPTTIFTASTTATGTFIWSIASGAIPTGLSFSTSTQTLSGTPTAANTFNFSIKATNGASSSTNAYSVLINPAAAPTTSTVNVFLVVSGGSATPSNFTVNVGPANVNANPSSFPGNVSGTAVSVTPAMTYTVGASAVTNYTENNSGACMGSLAPSASSTCTITETYAPVITTANLNVIMNVDNTLGGTATSSDFTIGVTGASAAPNSFGGSSAGTPVTVTGGATYSVAATNSVANYTAAPSGNCAGPISAGGSDSCTITETFSQASSTPTITIAITPSNLPSGTQSSTYSQILTASTTASGPFTWSIASGALPTGLALSTSTGTTAMISGTPTAVSTSPFTIQVTNGSASTTQNYTINIAAQGSIGVGLQAFDCTLPTSGNLIPNPNMTQTSTTAGVPNCWSSGFQDGTSTDIYTYPAAGPNGTSTPAAQIAISNYQGGDGKWYFQPVTIQPNGTYTFSDSYNSTAPTQLIAGYNINGTDASYVPIANLTATSGWATSTQQFTAPSNATSVTIFHLIQSNGTLTTTNYSLTLNGVQNCSALTSGNLIVNPSVGTSTISGTPDCWNKSSFGDASGTVFTYPATGPNGSSTKAVQLSIASYKDTGEGFGSAEWYPQAAPVTPGALYSFSDSYNSNTNSYIQLEWNLNDGTQLYDAAVTLPSSNGAWVTSPQEVFSAPVNAVSVVILHYLQSAGTLSVSNYSLAAYTPTGIDGFSKAIVSLTFDDDWETQYTNAQPILSAAGMPATFYIITSSVTPGINLITPTSSKTTSSTSTPITWSMPNVTSGTYQFTETYSATAPSTVSMTFNGTSTTLGTLPITGSATSTATFTILAKGNTGTMSVSQKLTSGGTVTVINPSVIQNAPENGPDGGYTSIAQLNTLQSQGDEIDSHTVTHPDLTSLTAAEAAQEIGNSRTIVSEMGAVPVSGVAYPFGDYNAGLETQIGNAGYSYARTVDVGYNTKNYNPMALKTYSVVASTTLAEVESWVNTAKANNWWLILTFHQIEISTSTIAQNGITDGTPEADATTEGMLQSIVSYLQSQGVTVENPNQVLGISTPTSTPPVVPTISISPATLANATSGISYLATLTASTTATGTFNWSIASGALPTGLALSTSTGTTATISGTPTANGSSTFSIKVMNGTASSTQAYTIMVAQAVATSTPTSTIPIVSLTPASGTVLTAGTIGTAYSTTFNATSTNATDTFTWTITGLPNGITTSISAGGTATISGTPTASGTSTIFVSARGANPSSTIASATYSLTINAPVATSTPTSTPYITIAPATIPDATVGTAYSQTVTASDANASDTFNWTIVTSTLSSDFTVATSTTGVTISGTPSTTGMYQLSLLATSVASTTQTASTTYTLTVDPAPAPTPAPVVTSVSGGGGGGGGGGYYFPIQPASTSTTTGVVLGASTTNTLAVLQSLLAQLVSLEQQLVTMEFKANGCPATFTKNLSQGMTDAQIENLQKVLNYTFITQVTKSGAGSPGNESTYFGGATKAAVITFQNIFANEILTPNGLTSGNGFVGASTRNELNSLCSQ